MHAVEAERETRRRMAGWREGTRRLATDVADLARRRSRARRAFDAHPALQLTFCHSDTEPGGGRDVRGTDQLEFLVLRIQCDIEAMQVFAVPVALLLHLRDVYLSICALRPQVAHLFLQLF